MATLPLLFDDEPEGEELLSVGDLTDRVRALLSMGFGAVGVRGEVSGVARPRSGHVYLTLKDDRAQLKAVMWRSMAARVKFDLEDGMAVRAWGGLEVYAPRGEYQLVIQAIEPEGIGALELAFRQAVARLAAEGLFDPSRKKPLPSFPRRVAIVTSPTGAAIRDFLQVLQRRWPSVSVLIIPVAVQGPGAADQIAAGIQLADRLPDIDIIITGRGGGSPEDLWAFNEESVARAIYHAQRPVVTAVGHEIDVTVADLVADVHALTPTDAAVRCVPDRDELASRLQSYQGRLAVAARSKLNEARNRLEDLRRRADRAIRIGLQAKQDRLARHAGRLEALSPLAVLGRGYSLTFRDGESGPLRAIDGLQPGDFLRTRLSDGLLRSRIEVIEPIPTGDR
ncbi:MAG: exodeoxyribonuclease VII large subunit [Isosphaeraceae bacterium]